MNTKILFSLVFVVVASLTYIKLFFLPERQKRKNQEDFIPQRSQT